MNEDILLGKIAGNQLELHPFRLHHHEDLHDTHHGHHIWDGLLLQSEVL